MFWKVEGRTGLYILFKTVCDVYGLIPEDNYTIPPEAEGIEPPTENTSSIPPLILKREPSDSGPQDKGSSAIIEGLSEHTLSTAGTTKRHRHSPSVGATSVTTVVEEAEEEEGPAAKGSSRPVTQIFETTPEEADEAEAEQPDDTAETEGEPEATEEAVPQEVHADDEAEEANTDSKDDADAEAEPKEEESTIEEPVAKEEPAASGFLTLAPEEHQAANDENEKPAEATEESEKKESAPEAEGEKDDAVSEPADKADQADESRDKEADA